MIAILLQYVAPILLGAAGGAAVQYFGLDVERRRRRDERRAAMVDDLRRAVVEHWPTANGPMMITGQGLELTRSEAYAKICAYLSPDLRRDLEPSPLVPGQMHQATKVVPGHLELRSRLLDELAGLEKKWGLT